MVFIVMLLGLSSCAVYEYKFDCPPGKGAHCSSVEEIEQMVNNGGVWKVNGKVKVATPKSVLGKTAQAEAAMTFTSLMTA
jgi:hypothetical protein